MIAYYNEIDPFAAAWLRELIKAGHIAPGEVDTRSIADVMPSDLAGFTQCHFFAGIGVWSYALRQAGWPDNRPVWTGSCPCPPFSVAGKKKPCPVCGSAKPLPHAYRTGVFRCTTCGHDWHADERHLWPELYRLTRECMPGVMLGEQVAGYDGQAWGDIVQSTLELEGYAVGRLSFAACGVGAPHIRQRLYWVALRGHRGILGASGSAFGLADSVSAGRPQWRPGAGSGSPSWSGGPSWMGDSYSARLEGYAGHGYGSDKSGRIEAHAPRSAAEIGGIGRVGNSDNQLESAAGNSPGIANDSWPILAGGLEHPSCIRRERGQATAPGHHNDGETPKRQEGQYGACLAGSLRIPEDHPGPTNGFWRDSDWLLCRDGRFRPVRPGSFPLAHGAAARVGRLRGYGNAINAEQAKAFIEAFMEVSQ